MNISFGEIMRFELFQLSGTSVTVGTLVVVVIILVATYLVSWVLRRGLQRMLRRDDPHSQGALRAVLRLVHYLILLIGLGVAMETLGLNLTTLLATGAVFAVGLGFALQNIVQNFVSGVILLIERSIKPEDVLEVEGRIVRVTRLGIRSTVARTLDEEDVIIPNSQLVQNTVKNYTMRDTLYRLRANVGVVYGSDMRKVHQVLEKTAAEITWRVTDKLPMILLTEFADSAVVFEVSVWISTPWNLRSRKSELNQAIWWALKDAGVVIAFPQMDVHFDPPVVDSLKLVAGRS